MEMYSNVTNAWRRSSIQRLAVLTHTFYLSLSLYLDLSILWNDKIFWKKIKLLSLSLYHFSSLFAPN